MARHCAATAQTHECLSVFLLHPLTLPPSLSLCAHRYVQATAWRPNYGRSFGYPLIYNVSGTLHTHVLGWKADLDIGGTSNSVNIHEMKVRQGPALSLSSYCLSLPALRTGSRYHQGDPASLTPPSHTFPTPPGHRLDTSPTPPSHSPRASFTPPSHLLDTSPTPPSHTSPPHLPHTPPPPHLPPPTGRPGG